MVGCLFPSLPGMEIIIKRSAIRSFVLMRLESDIVGFKYSTNRWYLHYYNSINYLRWMLPNISSYLPMKNIMCSIFYGSAAVKQANYSGSSVNRENARYAAISG